MPEKKENIVPKKEEKPASDFGEYELHIFPVPGIREPFEQRYLVSERDKETAEYIGIPESFHMSKMGTMQARCQAHGYKLIQELSPGEVDTRGRE